MRFPSHKQTTVYHPVIYSLDAVREALTFADIAEAAALSNAPMVELGMYVRQTENLSELRKYAECVPALIADSAHAAAVSRLVERLRAKAEKAQRKAVQAAPSPAEEPVLQADAPADPAPTADEPAAEATPAAEAFTPEETVQQTSCTGTLPAITKRPAFILLIDSLETVPSLLELPGAQPDMVFAPALEAAPEAVQEALLRTLGVTMDTLCAKAADSDVSSVVSAAHRDAAELLASGGATPLRAAELLLARGIEGGYIATLGKAVSKRCGVTHGQAMRALLPAIAGKVSQRPLAESLSTPCLVERLRLADVPDIVREGMHPDYPARQALTAADLREAVRSLYAFRTEPTPIEALVVQQEQFFRTGRTLPVAFRRQQLKMLIDWIRVHEAEIESALMQDLGKCAFESFETEIMLVLDEAKTLARHLSHWQHDRIGLAPVVHFPAATRRVRDPHGRVLIMAPWNYPFLLSMDPLLGAIAGGNCVVLKPSAYAPATSHLLYEMVHDLFDPEYVAVVEGGRAENQALLQQKFDHIFFTGSVNVGKLVMKSAAEHLTPVTLELGGKSPCIVDETADIALAARRITWGKFVNAGQTCVAPDYVLCHPDVADQFIMEVEKNIRALYGADPLSNGELCHIINEHHFDRLTSLLEGEEIAVGGQGDRQTRKLEPTVLRNVSWDAPVMQEEIFGPVMPIVLWDGDFEQMLSRIEDRPRPLAAYLFSNSRANKKLFMRRLRFGGGCINDVLCHLATSLPFGGVGESGMGAYHGRHSFNTFTHEKGVLLKSNKIDIKVRYAPYAGKLKLLRWFEKYLP